MQCKLSSFSFSLGVPHHSTQKNILVNGDATAFVCGFDLSDFNVRRSIQFTSRPYAEMYDL